MGNVCETIIFAGSLPIGHLVSVGERYVIVVERVGLQINAGGTREIGQHDNFQIILRREFFCSSNVEQCGHFADTVGVYSHRIRRETNEVGISQRLVCRESRAEFGIIFMQQIDGIDVRRA